nr:baseplate J/gp47 family protein [uncultured Dysosmobacter sp.]
MPEPFTAPEFIGDQTAEAIQQRMMDALPPDIDNTEGGWPWDFTMPTALEKAELLQFHLIEALKIMFPQWSYDTWLDLHAGGHAITRLPANAATGKLYIEGVAGTEIPLGFSFAVPAAGTQPAIEFITTEAATIGEEGNVTVPVMAAVAGPTGNVPADTIVLMSDPMKGITSITNQEPTTGGTEGESDDSLRERVLTAERTADASFVGCDADYIRWAKEVPGVGTPFVIANWDPDVKNSVKLVLLDGNGLPANEQIQTAVYNHIMHPEDPIQRKAPIGAILTVCAPTMKAITYAFKATLEAGYDAESVTEAIKATIQDYYTTAKAENLVQYIEIHAIITRTPGIYDFTGLTMNGSTENIALAADEYPQTASLDPGIPEEDD